MGKLEGIRVNAGGDQSHKGTQWSPDSKWITFTFKDHPSYPTGLYMVNVEDGTIKYLAPTGNGDRSSTFSCLAPSCGQGGPVYGTSGHPFSDMSRPEGGCDAKIVTDHTGNGAILLEPTWRIVRDIPRDVWRVDPALRIAAWYGNNEGSCHAHPQYSPNGRYIAWRSNLRTTDVYGPPPGPDDGLETSSDIFVIDHRPEIGSGP